MKVKKAVSGGGPSPPSSHLHCAKMVSIRMVFRVKGLNISGLYFQSVLVYLGFIAENVRFEALHPDPGSSRLRVLRTTCRRTAQHGLRARTRCATRPQTRRASPRCRASSRWRSRTCTRRSSLTAPPTRRSHGDSSARRRP